MSEITQILTYYVALLTLGIVGHAVLKRLYGENHAKGYAFSKIVGFLFLGYFGWVSKFIFQKEFISTFSFGIVVTIAVLVIWQKVRNSKPLIINKEYLFTEILFICAFAAMLVFRGSNPRIESIEKFMDYAIINSLQRETTLPPQDVWYSGENINYYYFGHYCISSLLKFSGIQPATGYNLTISFIFASSFIEAYALVRLLTKKLRYGLFGAMLLTLGSNFDYLFKFFSSKGVDGYFYASMRSLIDKAITEMPVYSFLISDLHAHIVDIPFVLLLIFLITILYKNKELIGTKLYIFVLAVSYGATWAINSWDMLIYAPIVGAVIFYATFAGKLKDLRPYLHIILLFALSVFLYLPNYLFFKPAVGGIGFYKFVLEINYITQMFGFFLIILAVFALSIIKKVRELDKTAKFAFLWCLFAVALVVAPEFVFIKDIYFKLNPPYFRANTIFKVWYQAWIIFCIFTPVLFLYTLKNVRNVYIKTLYRVVNMILVIFILAPTVSGISYIVGPKYIYKGLDGTNYLKQEDPDGKKMIDFINQNIKTHEVLLEASGDSYSMESLVSSYTGLPTLIGWTNHELGWRDNWPEIALRLGDIEKLYKNEEDPRRLLQKYHIKYVLVGPVETNRYGITAGDGLRTVTSEVAQFGKYRLLQVL